MQGKHLPQVISLLQEDPDKIGAGHLHDRWGSILKNVKKCKKFKVMHFGAKNMHTTYFMGEAFLGESGIKKNILGAL